MHRVAKLVLLWLLLFAGVFIARKTMGYLQTRGQLRRSGPTVRAASQAPVPLAPEDAAEELLHGEATVNKLRRCGTLALRDSSKRRVSYSVEYTLRPTAPKRGRLTDPRVLEYTPALSDETRHCIEEVIVHLSDLEIDILTPARFRYEGCFVPLDASSR